jgi:putative ABC transport system permease protein
VSKAPRSIPRATEIGIDGNVLLFLLAVSAVTAILFGVLPALQMSRGMPIASLREGGRGMRGGLARRGLRQALVVSEVALAVVLVVGASLLVKSFWKMQRVDPGFVPDRMLVVQLQLPQSRYGGYADAHRVRAFHAELYSRLAARPQVQSVTVAVQHPLSPRWTSGFTIAGPEPPPPRQGPAQKAPAHRGTAPHGGAHHARPRHARSRHDHPGGRRVTEQHPGGTPDDAVVAVR